MRSIAPITSLNGGQPVTAPVLKADDLKKLHDSAIQMEATFNGFMLNELSKGLPGTSGGTTDDFSGDVFGSIFKQDIATKMAEENGTHGIAQQFYQESLMKHARVEAQKQGISLPADAMVALRALPVGGSSAPTPASLSKSSF